jgi:hypothetical protein
MDVKLHFPHQGKNRDRSENMALRRISGLKRDKMTGGWTKFLNEEPHNLYPSLGMGEIKECI